MKFNFPIVIIDEDFRSENASGLGVRALADAISAEGSSVLGVTSYGDLSQFAQQQSRASAFILSIDDEEFGDGSASATESALLPLRKFITEIRARNVDIPIYLYGETRTASHLPTDILRSLHGFIHLFEDTPEFVARHIIREARRYLNNVAPPFFRALIDYAQDGSYSWHCPGHSGGVAFLKSPAGQMFHQFFGENMLRADVCNSVDELGQLLDHTGPIAQSERNAARIFSADHCFFVTNGTSTSNKIVWHSMVSQNDIVLIDRNCHKSVLHALIMIGAIPIFLPPTRNYLGIIGPIAKSEFTPDSIRRRIDEHPIVRARNLVGQRARVLTLTQSTYDGILYNAQEIKEMLDGVVDRFHFDEAWIPHASFHPFYTDMHAIGKDRNRPVHSPIFVTQSTHKLLAGISQASQILVQDATHKKLDVRQFNEAYLMHSSTSPQYAIIASCDITAAMMESPGGTALVQESLEEAIAFRRTMRRIQDECIDDWWFGIWGPEHGEAIVADDWRLDDKNSNWHGFGPIVDGFNQLDPIKVTLTTPGLNLLGEFAERGIPATIVSKYLATHGIVVEKTGWYSFFIIFTIGITKGRWNTLVAALQQFKDDYDNNILLLRALPQFCQKHPQYERMGLADLCQGIHHSYREFNVTKLTSQMYLTIPEIVRLPSETYQAVSHQKTVRTSASNALGKIAASLITPYPPGIPLLIPGERVHQGLIDYLSFIEQFQRQYPGFESDIHGVSKEDSGFWLECLADEL